ncbi:unnamed protein product [Ectocarpus sp. CCAP 1310/34]|nr:unnamed protein product [Ectocarpus sp. CCAP 1310/34]
MSLSSPLSHGLLKDLGKLAELKGRRLILDCHLETKKHIPLSHGLLKDLGKLAELKGRRLILDCHLETKKHMYVKAGNSVAKERWDAIESAWGLKQDGIFDGGEWIAQIDGEIQGITSSTRLSLSSQQDASSARCAAAPSQHPPAAAAGTARRKVDRGKQARERAAKGTLGGNICNALNSTAPQLRATDTSHGSLNSLHGNFALSHRTEQIERTRGGVKKFVPGISFPPPAPESRRSCPHCPMTFVNEQGLGIHVRTQHSSANLSNGVRLRRMLRKNLEGSVLPWEEAGPGRCWHVKVDDATGAASLVIQRKRFLDLDLESDGFMDRETKEPRGAPKHRRYDDRFKANAVNQLRILEGNAVDLWKEEERTPPQYLEDRLKVHYSNIVSWAKDEKATVAEAADDVKKSLLAKQQPKRWFPEAEKRLYKMFVERRKRKSKVSTLWLTITFRRLVREMYPGDQRAAAFRAYFRWARKRAKRHNLSKRRRTNLKNKSVEERLPTIQRFHRRFRKLLQEPVRYRAPDESDVSAITTVAERESRVPKFGQFQLWERWNVDQVPLAFVNGLLDTWEERGAKRVAISQPFPGLETRQCTMQVIFGPGRVPQDVDVFFQENAWADQKSCMEWAKRSYREGLMRGRGELPKAMSILIMDKFFAQTTDEFKEAGRFIKVEAGRQMDMWLEQSDNLGRWETAALTASNRRVLITQWIGAAMARLNSQHAFRFHLIERCGMAMTVDGSGNDRITLEGLDKPYTFANDEDCSEDEEGLEIGSDEPEGRGKEGDGREAVVEGADSSDDEDDGGTSQTQTDELALLDDDDSMDPQDPEDETQRMEVPTGFRIQEVTPVALDRLLLRRGVLVFRLGMGWFGGLIIQQSQPDTRHLYDYCVQLELDQSTRKMKLPLAKYTGDLDAAVGSWVLLESVSRSERVRRINVTLVDQDG